jgi:hypothetical protein
MVRTQFQSIGTPNSVLSFLRHFNIYLSRNSSRKQHWKKCFHHGNKPQVKKHEDVHFRGDGKKPKKTKREQTIA